MDIEQRIEQFRTMAEADPENDMAHFSLGMNLLQAQKPEKALISLKKAIELNETLSKAYQLAGEACLLTKDQDQAIETLTKGYKVASSRGDLMPKQAMETMLRELGALIPEVEQQQEGEAADGSFICHATGRPGTKMDKPPFKGQLGEKIAECISKEAWNAWISQGTKVINELRLDLSREDHQKMYDQYMIEYLGLQDVQ